MRIKTKLSDKTNYTPGRTLPIRYIVIHYTGNNGDTAANNARYFSQPGRGASAHYFVDENEIYKTVLNGNTAWHCGAKTYLHTECRNSNSLGVELCSRRDGAGKYYFSDATVDNAVELVRQLMAAYNIPPWRVIRHYDVTGKNCPAPFVQDPAAWNAFRARLQ